MDIYIQFFTKIIKCVLFSLSYEENKRELMQEVWKDIEAQNGDYQISNLGNVRSLKYSIPRTLKSRANGNGYLYVNLCQNGKYKSKTVHRLVAEHFLSGSKHLCINHIDGNKSNNTTTNLEFVTIKENMHHAINTGLLVLDGEANPNSKLTENDVREIRSFHKKGLSSRNLAKMFKVSKSTVLDIVNNKLWKHLAESKSRGDVAVNMPGS